MKLFVTTLILSFGLLSVSSTKKPSKKRALKVLTGFTQYIPSGNSVIDGDTASVQAFYMSTTEITNFQYMEFVYDLKNQNETEKLKVAIPDSNLWNTSMGWEMNGYKRHYYGHPAYHSYPVVNISKEGAELYCDWLTSKYDTISNGELNIKFRLPSKAEWIRAARGDNHFQVFAWQGIYLRNKDGQILANHLSFGSENIHYNLESKTYEIKQIAKVAHAPLDAADVTAPAKSYWPNEFGLYNMNGNVSEMIADENIAIGGDWHSPGFDIQNESFKVFDSAHPTVGFRIVASYVE